MRILIIASGNFYSTYGGGQVYVKNIVDEFINQKQNIVVFSFVSNILSVEKSIYRGVELYEIGMKEQQVLEQLIVKIQPDIIHAHSQKALMCTIGKKMHIPVIVTAHHGGIICPVGTLLNVKDEVCHLPVCHVNCLSCVLHNIRSGRYWYPFMKHLPLKLYLSLGKYLAKAPFIPFITPIGMSAIYIHQKQTEWQSIIKDSTCLIAPCFAIKEVMARNGLDEKRIIVIPHGIPIFSDVSLSLSIRNKCIKFFYLGRICYVKGIHVLLQAFHALRASDVELHLIGGAGNKEECRYMIRLQKKYHKDSRIVWHGKVSPEQVSDKIKNMHVSIAPSICLETFGLNIAESLAMGKPVIATRCGGAEMQIENGVNGWLIASNDVEALKSKMEDIIRDSSVMHLVRMNKGVVSIGEHCRSLLELYNRLITR